MEYLFQIPLEVGDPVARDDGRFYVPVNRVSNPKKLSPTVLRIASDAFPDPQMAIDFADEIVEAFNERFVVE
jgi:hypothetical protein